MVGTVVRIATEKGRIDDGRYEERKEEKRRHDREPRVDLNFAGGLGNPIPNPILSNTKLKLITFKPPFPGRLQSQEEAVSVLPCAHPSLESN